MRAKRLNLEIEQKDVAQLVGVTTDTITNWELNRCHPAVKHYPKITEFLEYCVWEYPRTLGERLRLFRIHMGLSLKKFAKLMEVDPFSLKAWESSKRNPTKESREKIQRWLKTRGVIDLPV